MKSTAEMNLSHRGKIVQNYCEPNDIVVVMGENKSVMPVEDPRLDNMIVGDHLLSDRSLSEEGMTFGPAIPGWGPISCRPSPPM
jgi:hypothetical protein